MSRPAERERPVSVAAALALTALAGVANVVVGLLILGLLNTRALPNSPSPSRSALLMTGWTYLLLGVVTSLGAYALLQRGPGSRVFVTVLMFLRIATACISFAVIGTWYSGGSVIGIVLSVAVIALLWDSRANAYFHVPH